MDPRQQKVNIAPARKEPWWAFPISVHQEAAGTRISIAWRRMALQLLGLAACGWLLLVCSVFLWVKYYRGFSDVQFTNILLPHRWKEYSTARGNFYIKQAKEEIAAQKWVDAIHHLRVGVAAAPSNTEGRLILAQFFTLFGRIELAKRTLVEGVPFGKDDPEYLKALFGFLLQYQEDDEIRRIAAEQLPPAPSIDNRTQLIALAAATANFYRGAYDAAEALIEDYRLLGTKDGRMLQVRIDWERGNRDLALQRLGQFIAAAPDDDDFYSQLVTFNRELGRLDLVAKYALLRELANPKSAAARIDLLLAYRMNGNDTKYRESAASILRDFPDDRTTLLALANFGTEHGDAELALRVFRHLKEHNLETDAAGLMVAEAYIVAGQHQAALDFLLELGRSRPEWLQKFLGIVNGLQAVACYGLGQREDGDLYLTHFLAQPNIRAEHLTAISNRLIAVGAKTEARRVLLQAVTADTRNQNALTRLCQLDLERSPSDELIANLRRLIAMRRPSSEVLQLARRRLASDRFLFVAGRDELLASIQATLARSPVPVIPAS